MKGLLVVNSFIKLNKFLDIYDMLKNSAKELDICLQIKTSAELTLEMENGEFFSKEKPDFILFWDKDIYLAKRLENYGVRLFNNANAVEVCDNKNLTFLALENKVKMPKTILSPKTFEGVNYNNLEFVKKAVEKLGLPLIIKETFGSFGKQVYLANTLSEAEEIVKSLGYKDFLMQQFVSSSVGKDVRVNVVGNKVVSAIYRENKNDFRSNITNGGTGENYTPTKEQIDLALKACKIIGLDFAGVDILFGENKEPVLCEINSNPHFKSTLEITNKDMSKEIMLYIKEQIK